MIYFVTTQAHSYTTAALNHNFGVDVPRCHSLTYDQLFNASHIGAATFIFTDIERLSHHEMIVASGYYRMMGKWEGFRVLNDAAKVKLRYGLLRSLRQSGINDFDAYRADGHPAPRRFPVFVRTEAAHDPALTRLLTDQGELDQALDRLVAAGHPLRGLIVIEYRAEPVSPGVFRRWGTFVIGDNVHLDHVVQEDNWNVKFGTHGLTSEIQFIEFKDAIEENRFSGELRRVFDVANIEYGRADFGFADGRPQIYEINTNPMLSELQPHRSASWASALRFAHKRFALCLNAIDSHSGQELRKVDKADFPGHVQRSLVEIMRQKGQIMKPSPGR